MTYLLSLATYESGFQLVGVDLPGVDSLRLHFVGSAPTSERLRLPHHARSSQRHGHQFDDMAVVVLVIGAAAPIPIVELSVFKGSGARLRRRAQRP